MKKDLQRVKDEMAKI